MKHNIQRGVYRMGIIQQAVLSDRRVRSTRELIEREIDTLRIVYEHNAISEAEYNRSLAVLKRQLSLQDVHEHREKLSDIIGSYRNSYPVASA